MKIKYKKGGKGDWDRIFSISTQGDEVFTHARLMILINALAKNEYLIYKKGGWEEKGKPFLYMDAVKDAIQLGINGITFIDEEDKDSPELRKFCDRNCFSSKFGMFKQTLLNDFEEKNGHA